MNRPEINLYTEIDHFCGANEFDLLETQKNHIGKLFARFSPISLEDTNNKAKMLSRVDRKYILTFEQLEELSKQLLTQYSLLAIDGLSQFSYASCYYDDHFDCYHEHHQGRRQRVKVRTRKYVDCGLTFFEVKLKGARGKTDKHRVKCNRLVMPIIEGEKLQLLKTVYGRQYNKPIELVFKPSLNVGYTRTTLVALKGSERVTIDYGLTFKVPHSSSSAVEIGNNFIIVETKSKDGMGTVDRILKESGIRTASKCSKYCIGAILTGCVQKKNAFLPTVRKISPNIIKSGTLSMRASF